MSLLRFLYALITIFVFAALVFVSPTLASSTQEAASLVITNAEETIVAAYKAVLEAEQTGGNVTGLLTRLNEAGESLATARMFYRNGDYDNAIRFADSCRNIGEGVKSSAYELKDLAWNEEVQRMSFTMFGSISGIISVVLGSFWVWHLLKKRYQ